MTFATIRVKFGNEQGGAANGIYAAEIDTRPGGLNNGNSAFIPGDTVYILLYRTPNVTTKVAASSAGALAKQVSPIQFSITETITFADTNVAALPKPLAAGQTLDVLWFGTSLGALTLDDDGVTLRAASKGVAVAQVTYITQADVYNLYSPADINGSTAFSLLVFFRGVAA